MARIKGKDIYLNDDDQVYFGDNQEAALWFDGNEWCANHTISGTAATQGYHLVRKDQIPDDFLDLIDTPTTYSGYGLSLVRVKSDETGLEFLPPSATTISGIEYRDFSANELMLGPQGFRPSINYAGPIGGLAFDDSKQEEVFGSFRISELLVSNENIILTIYALNDDAQTSIKMCRWCIEYHTYSSGENYTSKTTTTVCGQGTLSNNAAAGEEFEATLALSYNDANNPLTKDLLTFKIYRSGADINDTLIGDAILALASFRQVVTEA
jgi:hypothetical protein